MFIQYLLMGTSPGASGDFINKHLNKKNIEVNAYFSIIMPDTWTPMFDLTDSNKIKNTLEKSTEEIKNIIPKIKNKENGNFMDKKKSYLISKIGYILVYNRGMRKTKNFGASNDCVSCGKCEKSCPINAIKIIDNRPRWIKKKCLACLRCLHRCPNFAIQYGTNTIKHGQYLNPYVDIE
ncbi:EFR1 family ferrodoxin [Methanobrevibacter sp. 87.7]|uniref:EFR1 family ferrodoxin n=1 Tax=Methanobrevibacter sp. 87.7 TaxID=387957 RepID=UPI000B500278|nr:EFR1 family ferrodoxin [Methanobrevibacter sp. 87.7]